MAKILILHGPNLNLLGLREPDIYGHETLHSIDGQLASLAEELGHSLLTLQSNAEHILTNRIQECLHDKTDFIIINPAAFTHSSIALRDALLAVKTPFIEVHLSNIHCRDAFRHHSYFSDIAAGTITGLGTQSYLLALRYAHHYLTIN